MTARRTALFTLLLGLGVAGEAHAAAKLTTVGGKAASLRVCGATGPVRQVALGDRLTFSVLPATTRGGRDARVGARMVVERCEGGAWKQARTYRLGKRRQPLVVVPPTDADATGDLRVRTRTKGGRFGRPSIARIGVGEVVDVPIDFRVVNQNRTALSCTNAPDGRTYPIHGTLVAPRSVLEAGTPAVTLYLHGVGYSSFFFRFKDVPGYDYGQQQARAGHASVVVDRLGNPAHDDLPDGNATCFPAQADMADQVIGKLRAGDYTGGPATRFAKVLLAGHSAGGLTAEFAQSTFGSADALALISATNTPSGLALAQFGEANAMCAAAPQRSRKTSGNPGYAPFGVTDADFAGAHFSNIDPEVRKAVLARRNLDPCGDLTSATQPLLANQAGGAQVTKPVLVISGREDALFAPPSNQLQATTFPNAGDVDLVELPDTGHAITLGRTHDAFREAMDRWLTERGA